GCQQAPTKLIMPNGRGPRPGRSVRGPGVAALARAAVFAPRPSSPRGRLHPAAVFARAAALALARSAPPRPSEPRCATRGGPGGEQAPAGGPPGQRADDPVDDEPERLLEAAHGGRGLGPEYSVNREAVARTAGLRAKPELFLETAYRVPGAAAGQHDDQGA